MGFNLVFKGLKKLTDCWLPQRLECEESFLIMVPWNLTDSLEPCRSTVFILKLLYATRIFLQNIQPTKHFTIMYRNGSCTPLSLKGKIFGWMNKFCIMTMYLTKHCFWWRNIWLIKNIYVGAYTISLIWSQMIFPCSKNKHVLAIGSFQGPWLSEQCATSVKKLS